MRRLKIPHTISAASGLVLLVAQTHAGPPHDPDVHWPQFRGPRARGVAEGSETPVAWDVASGSNIRWKTPIPGLAHSSPVIWGDRLFVTTAVRDDGEAFLKVGLYGAGDSVADEGVHEFLVYCLDKRGGSVRWVASVQEARPKVQRHPKSSHANPTPATDGRYVVAFFGSEGLYCLDVYGDLVWKRDLGVLDAGAPGFRQYQWGFASWGSRGGTEPFPNRLCLRPVPDPVPDFVRGPLQPPARVPPSQM